MKSPITTHILDTANGHPAHGVNVTLEKESGSGRWEKLAEGITDGDGRITDWMPAGKPAETGRYRVIFDTGTYFKNNGQKEVFYPEAQVVFNLHHPDQHYHIPLLLNPFGYSTYRGS